MWVSEWSNYLRKLSVFYVIINFVITTLISLTSCLVKAQVIRGVTRIKILGKMKLSIWPCRATGETENSVQNRLQFFHSDKPICRPIDKKVILMEWIVFIASVTEARWPPSHKHWNSFKSYSKGVVIGLPVMAHAASCSSLASSVMLYTITSHSVRRWRSSFLSSDCGIYGKGRKTQHLECMNVKHPISLIWGSIAFPLWKKASPRLNGRLGQDKRSCSFNQRLKG